MIVLEKLLSLAKEYATFIDISTQENECAWAPLKKDQ